MALNPGDLLNNGRYLIVEEVGSGGFGTVYKAVNTGLWSSPVAVKFSTPQFPPARNASEQERQRHFLEQARRRFEDEAKLLYELRHSNLPRVLDYFDEPEQGQFMVMDFIEGQSLADLLEARGGPLPEAEALFYIRQVGGALHYLHNRIPPIIHRDVKPTNIILTADNQVFLVDFGIAKVYVGDGKSSRNPRGVSSGFSPPEQYDPRVPTTPRSDVYALGATLYTLLTYTGRYEDELIEAPARSSHPEATRPPHEKDGTISEQTSVAVMRAISLLPAERPAGVAEFLDRLPDLPYRPQNRPNESRPPASSEGPPEDVTAIHSYPEPATPTRPQIRAASKLPLPGQTWLGRFQVHEKLHPGLILARDTFLQREVEIWLWKILRTPDIGSIHKMLGNYAKLQHEALAGVPTHGNADGHGWLVTPHMPGGSLAARLEAGKLEPGEVTIIIDRLAAALDYIHGRGVIHGELHPLLVQFDDAGAAYLRFLDFSEFMEYVMDTAWVIPHDYLDYRSPEYDSAAADARSDIYSLGGILFAMLTGLSPAGYVPGDKKAEAPAPKAPAVAARAGLSMGVRSVIDRALAPDPAGRFASAGALAAGLREAIGQDEAIETLSGTLIDLMAHQPELLDPLARALREATRLPGGSAAAAKALREQSNRPSQPAKLAEVFLLAADRPDLIAAYAKLVALLPVGLTKESKQKPKQTPSPDGSRTQTIRQPAPPAPAKPASRSGPAPQPKTTDAATALPQKRPAQPVLSIGSTFRSRYHITDLLSDDGETHLFLARGPVGRKVTVRVRHSAPSPAFDKTMTRVMRLEHWALAPVYEFGRIDDGRSFVVSAFYPGGSLSARLDGGVFSLEQAADVIYRVADALNIAHGHGLTHRRLDPGSIFFDAADRAWLSLHAIDPEQDGRRAAPGRNADTSANPVTSYTSPEQVLGQPSDWRADIYALGIILYEMLIGEPPFRAESFAALADRHLSAPVPILRAKRGDLPEDLQAIIEHALAKDPAQRYQAVYRLGQEMHWAWGK